MVVAASRSSVLLTEKATIRSAALRSRLTRSRTSGGRASRGGFTAAAIPTSDRPPITLRPEATASATAVGVPVSPSDGDGRCALPHGRSGQQGQRAGENEQRERADGQSSRHEDGPHDAHERRPREQRCSTVRIPGHTASVSRPRDGAGPRVATRRFDAGNTRHDGGGVKPQGRSRKPRALAPLQASPSSQLESRLVAVQCGHRASLRFRGCRQAWRSTSSVPRLAPTRPPARIVRSMRRRCLCSCAQIEGPRRLYHRSGEDRANNGEPTI